eukprot:12933467-Prorocentrum_lima.AAC.1
MPTMLTVGTPIPTSTPGPAPNMPAPQDSTPAMNPTILDGIQLRDHILLDIDIDQTVNLIHG